MQCVSSFKAGFKNVLMLMESTTPFAVFSNCMIVRGASRACICDTQRDTLYMVPHSLVDFMEQYEGRAIEAIKQEFDVELHLIIDEYFEFLLNHELIFFTRTPHLFPKMALNWDLPNLISNAIIDIDDKNQWSYGTVARELDELGCRNLEIRCYAPIPLSRLEDILSLIEDLTITSVSLILQYNEELTELSIKEFSDKYLRITGVTIHSSPVAKNIRSSQYAVPITYTEKIILDESCCGIVAKESFISYIQTFTEAMHYNSCLNRKISIDKNGNIKNCPSMAVSYGHINDTSLVEVLSNDAFKSVWNIKKDDIVKCRDCEFRYVCTDCRAYLDDPEDIYSAPLKCGYNPYTCEWEEWSTHPLKQKSIGYYGTRETF